MTLEDSLDDDGSGLTLSAEDDDGLRFFSGGWLLNERPVRGLTFSLVAGAEGLEEALDLREEVALECNAVLDEISSSRKMEKVVLGMTARF